MARERIRALEIEIHGKQPHLDRIVVAIMALGYYLEEQEAKPCQHCLHQAIDNSATKPPTLPTLPLPPGAK